MENEDSQGFKAERWVKEFAQDYRIVNTQPFSLETVVPLLNNQLQYKLLKARPHLSSKFPEANEWIDAILSNKRAVGDADEKAALAAQLLDSCLATDLVVRLRDNHAQEQIIAIDVTANPDKEPDKLNTIRGKRDIDDPPNFNRNANLPAIRRRIGITKHLVLVVNPDNPPDPEHLLTQVYVFANAPAKTGSLNLWTAVPNSEQAQDQTVTSSLTQNSQQLWNQYNQNGRLTDLSKLIRKAKVEGQSPETIARMLEHHPNYFALAQKTGKQAAQQYNIALVQRELEQQRQQALEVAGIVKDILKLPTPKIQRQAGGSAVLQGNSFDYRQQRDVVSLIAHDGRGEILRVQGEQVEIDRLSEQDLGQCRKVQEQLAVYQRESQPKEWQQRRKGGPRQ